VREEKTGHSCADAKEKEGKGKKGGSSAGKWTLPYLTVRFDAGPGAREEKRKKGPGRPGL